VPAGSHRERDTERTASVVCGVTRDHVEDLPFRVTGSYCVLI